MCSFKELLISVFIPPFPNCKVIPIERLHCNRRDYILLWRKSATITSCGANVMLQQSDKLNCIYILAVMCRVIYYSNKSVNKHVTSRHLYLRHTKKTV